MEDHEAGNRGGEHKMKNDGLSSAMPFFGWRHLQIRIVGIGIATMCLLAKISFGARTTILTHVSDDELIQVPFY